MTDFIPTQHCAGGVGPRSIYLFHAKFYIFHLSCRRIPTTPMNVGRQKKGNVDGLPSQSLAVLATNLDKALAALGWRMQDLKDRCGYSRPFVMAILKGKQNPSLDAVHIIAVSLGLEAHNLIDAEFIVPDLATRTARMVKLSNTDVAELRQKFKAEGSPCREYFAGNLKRMMKQRGTTATMIYQATGMASSTVHKALNKNQNVTLETVDTLACHLNVPPSLLIMPL